MFSLTLRSLLNLWAASGTQRPRKAAGAVCNRWPARLGLEGLEQRLALSDVTGQWQGTLSQVSGGPASLYNFGMDLTQSQNAVTGTSRIEIIDHPQYYGVMTLTGNVTGNQFAFQEPTIIEFHPPPGYYWLLKSGTLEVSADGTSMTGTWSSGIYHGSINLTKRATVTPTSVEWNTTSGGLDFSYNVDGSDLTQDVPVDLYWATGEQWSARLGNVSGDSSPLFVVSAGTPAGDYGPVHIDADVFANAPDAPAATTNILVVTDPNNSLGNFDSTRNVEALLDVQVSEHVKRLDFPLSDHTSEEVKKLLRASGQGDDQTAIVTSSIRTPYEQARAMYTNLEQGNNVRYRRPGQAVVAVYYQDKQDGLPKDQILADMEQEIINQGPFNVSHHCSTPELWSMLQVLDIAPSSITNRPLFRTVARQAVEDGDLSRFLDRAQGDPAFHIEIPQPAAPSAGTGKVRVKPVALPGSPVVPTWSAITWVTLGSRSANLSQSPALGVIPASPFQPAPRPIVEFFLTVPSNFEGPSQLPFNHVGKRQPLLVDMPFRPNDKEPNIQQFDWFFTERD